MTEGCGEGFCLANLPGDAFILWPRKKVQYFFFIERLLNPLILMLVYKNVYSNSLMCVLISKA